ncbi:MAG: Fic family protein [bacterium]
MAHYVWQLATWPEFEWESETLLKPLGATRGAQGRLLAKAELFGLELQAEVLAEEAFTTAAIEGEKLDRRSVRSSVARRLGLPTAGLPPVERHIDGLVQMLIDATTGHDQPLDGDRLKGWHAALFPTGYSALNKIMVGDWRPAAADPMQVVSGPVGREKIHYEAPPAARLEEEMARLFAWWRDPPEQLDGLVRAALAHLWFVTIHPFEDGNGRIARALADMALAQDERSDCRLYSMSAQINLERDEYYDVLERTQKGDGDVTAWLQWFLGCQERSLRRSEEQVEQAMRKARFWQQCAEMSLNKRQQKVINRLLDAGPDGFEGGLTNRKYRSMTTVPPTTAKRDLADLLRKGLIKPNPGGGRSVSYALVWPA